MRRLRHHRGLTLLETLVCISILGGLLLVSTSLLRDVSDSRRRTERRMRVVEGATVLLDTMSSHLTVATVSDAAGAPGIVGDSTSIRITGSGVSVRRLAGDSDISPLVDRSSIRIELRGDGLEMGEEGFESSRIVPDLFAIRFRYHDGSDWRDAWDSGRDGLPVAVEARLWFDAWTDGRHPDWMPLPEESGGDDFDGLEVGEFEGFSEFGDLDGAPPAQVPMEDGPAPDRMRIVALLDPVPMIGNDVAPEILE